MHWYTGGLVGLGQIHTSGVSEHTEILSTPAHQYTGALVHWWSGVVDLVKFMQTSLLKFCQCVPHMLGLMPPSKDKGKGPYKGKGPAAQLPPLPLEGEQQMVQAPVAEQQVVQGPAMQYPTQAGVGRQAPLPPLPG